VLAGGPSREIAVLDDLQLYNASEEDYEGKPRE
jgi:hypothetical protein